MRSYIKLLLNALRNAKQLRDYGLSCPWPPSPPSLTRIVAKFHAAYDRWRAWMVIRAIPSQDWPQLRLKVTLDLHSVEKSVTTRIVPESS